MAWIELTADQGVQELASGKLGGRFDVVKNLSQLASGSYLTKRLGYSRIASSSHTYVLRMDQYNATRAPMWLDTVREYDGIGTTGGQVFVMNPDDSSNLFYYAGSFGTCKPKGILTTLSSKYATSSAFASHWRVGMFPPDVAVNASGWVCVLAPRDDSTIFVQVMDPTGIVTNRTLFDAGSATTGNMGKVFALGDTFYAAVRDGLNLQVNTMDPTSDVGWTFNGTITTVTPNWDLTTNGTDWWIIKSYTSTQVRVEKFTGLTPGATANITSNLTSSGSRACTITWIADCPTDTLWLGYRNGDTAGGNGIEYTVLNEDLTDATGGSGPYTLISSASLSRKYDPPVFGKAEYMGFEDYSPATTAAALGMMYHRDVANADYWTTAFLAATTGAQTSTYWRYWYYVRPLSKPDDNNRFWCIATGGGTQDGEFYRPMFVRAAVRWYDLTDTVIELGLSVELTGGLYQYGALTFATDFHWFSSAANGSSSSFFAVPAVRQATDLAHEIQVQVLEYELPTQNPRLHTARLWDQLLVSGAPTIVGANPFSSESDETDGDVMPMLMGSSEVAFNEQPVITEVSGTSGGSMTAGTYKHMAVRQFVDAQGRRHRSAPSPIVETTITTETRISINITTPTCTVRGSTYSHLRPTTLVYRTENGGDVFKFTGQSNCSATGSIVSFYDDNADATIADEEPIYTDGGVLAFETAPSCRWVSVSEGRVWCAGLFQRELVQCSNTLIPTEGVSFTDDNAYRVILPGDSEGIASMDGRTVLFTKNGVYLVTGAGPDRQGVGTFGQLQTLSTGIGCINGYSVLTTPVGVVFQSRDGYYLLPKGFGAVVPIGDAIRDTVASGDGQYCWGCALVKTPTGIEARWLVSTDAGTDPYTLLVLNIRTMQWSIDVLAPQVSPRVDTFGAIGTWQKGCVLAHTDLNNAYPIRYQESDSAEAVDDAGGTADSYVQSTLRTSWQHPFGVGKQGKLHNVLVNLDGGDYKATITVETVGYSYSTSTVSKQFTSASAGTPYTQYLIGPRQKECVAYRVTIADEQNSAANSTFGVVSIWADATDHDREAALPSARRG